MLTLDELKKMAARLSGSEFVSQIGPILLLQQGAQASLAGGNEFKRTAALPALKRPGTGGSEPPRLLVAVLPPLLEAGGRLRIGRTADNDIILDEPSSSKEHAVLVYANGEAQLTDLGSMNGTSVNDQALTAHQPRVLKEGDAIRFGAAQYVYFTSQRMFEQISGSQAKPAP